MCMCMLVLQIFCADFASNTLSSLIFGNFSLGPALTSTPRALPVPNVFSMS